MRGVADARRSRDGRAARGRARPSTRPTRSFSAPSHCAAGEAATPAAQMMVAASSASSPIVTPAVVALRDRRAETDLDAQLSRASCCAALLSIGGKAGSTRGPASTSTMRASRGSMLRKSWRKRRARQLGDGARHLDAGRAAADHDEGEEAAARLGLVGGLGILEGGQDAAADGGGVVDLLQAGRHALPFVVAEIGMPRAGRQHQIVVGDRRDPRRVTVRRCLVDAGHLAQQHAHVRPRCAGWRGSARRSAPATGRRSPPGRAAAGRDGSCAGR